MSTTMLLSLVIIVLSILNIANFISIKLLVKYNTRIYKNYTKLVEQYKSEIDFSNKVLIQNEELVKSLNKEIEYVNSLDDMLFMTPVKIIKDLPIFKKNNN